MRIWIAVSMLTLLPMAGCSSGDIPTPVPSNTPTPSAQDSQPTGNPASDTPVGPTPNEPTSNEPATEAPTTDEATSAVQPVIPPVPYEPEERFLPAPTDSHSAPSPEAETAPVDPKLLVEKLADANERDLVTRQLVAEGSAAVEPLLGALKSDNWEVRASAIFCLGQLGSNAGPALPELKEIAMSDEVAAVRDAAAFAIDALERQSNQP